MWQVREKLVCVVCVKMDVELSNCKGFKRSWRERERGGGLFVLLMYCLFNLIIDCIV